MTILFSVLTTLILIGAKLLIPGSDWPSYLLALPFGLLFLSYALHELVTLGLTNIFWIIKRTQQDTFPVAMRRSFPTRAFPSGEELVTKRYEDGTQIIDITKLLNHRKKQQERGYDNDPA